MHIVSIHLVNYCRHENLALTFDPGLNLLWGPNGSGKSTILNAMLFALTGQIREVGVKNDNIRVGAKASHVELCFNADIPLLVHAGLSPDRWQLFARETGEKLVQGQRAVVAEIQARTGLTKQQMADYVFVGQRGVDAWLDKSGPNRALELAQLFGIGEAEKAYGAITKFLSDSPELLVSLPDSDLSTQVASFEAELRATRIAHAAIPHDLDTQIDTLNKRWRAAQQLTRRQELTFNKVRVERALADATAEYERLQKVVAAGSAEAAVALEHINNAAAYAQYNETARSWLAALRAARRTQLSTLAGLPRHTVIPTEAEYDARLTAVNEYTDLCAGIARRIKDRKKLVDVDACPTCGQPVPDPAEYAAQMLNDEQLLATLQQRLNLEREAVAAMTRVWRETTKYWEARVGLKQERTNVLKQLREKQRPPVRLNVQLQAVVAQHAAMQQALTAVHVTLQQLNTEHATYVRELAATADEDVADSTTSELQRQIDALLAQQRDRDRLAYECKSIERSLLTLTERMQQEAVQRRIAERHNAVRRVLVQSRELLHKDAAPKDLVQARLQELEAHINATLELFAAPFRVRAANMYFEAVFRSGVVQPDTRLSGGERVVLSLAMRIALNAAFAGQFGVLALDEPTAHLDEHNLGCLPAALQQLRAVSSNAGLQVFFVTHEQRLQSLFDNVVTLEAAQ